MYQLEGAVKLVNDPQTFPSGFVKREFVVTTDEKFPQDIKFEVVKENCSLLDGVEKGENVVVHFRVRGNEFKGKYYVNLVAWKLERTGGGGGGGRSYSEPMSEPRGSADGIDDDPFADEENPF